MLTWNMRKATFRLLKRPKMPSSHSIADVPGARRSLQELTVRHNNIGRAKTLQVKVDIKDRAEEALARVGSCTSWPPAGRGTSAKGPSSWSGPGCTCHAEPVDGSTSSLTQSSMHVGCWSICEVYRGLGEIVNSMQGMLSTGKPAPTTHQR